MLKLNYYTYKTIFNHKSRNGRIIRTQQKTNMQFTNKKIELYNDNQIDRYNFIKSLASFNI